jgi:hypothetical protein
VKRILGTAGGLSTSLSRRQHDPAHDFDADADESAGRAKKTPPKKKAPSKKTTPTKKKTPTKKSTTH